MIMHIESANGESFFAGGSAWDEDWSSRVCRLFLAGSHSGIPDQIRVSPDLYARMETAPRKPGLAMWLSFLVCWPFLAAGTISVYRDGHLVAESTGWTV